MQINIRLSMVMLLLTIILFTLKLCGVITCSWLWVLSPIWLPFALLFVSYVTLIALSWLLFRDVKKNIYNKIDHVD